MSLFNRGAFYDIILLMKMKFAILFSLAAICTAGVVHASDGLQEAWFYGEIEEVEIVSQEEPCGLACAIEKFALESNKQTGAMLGWRANYSLCPFHTNWECNIWFRKPHIKETMSFPSRSIGKENEAALRAAINSGDDINMNAPYAKPLVNRYKMLQNAAQACCTEGMKHRLRRAGATPGLIYKFLVDDANFYGFSARCLMMTEEELAQKYPRTATANAVSDTRDTCLCQRRDWFDALLAPFENFSDADFIYTFEDGLRREQTVSITNDVQTMKYFLSLCP